jgi:hypothetical protein
MPRTDKFRPSVIDPTKFEFIGHHYIGGMSDDTWAALCDEINEGAEALETHQKAHPGFTVAGHKWPGQCDCCGARYKFGAWFHTAETNTYIAIGGICARKLSLGSPEAMKRFREQVNTYKVHAERVAKARVYLASVGLIAMLDLFLSKSTSREFPEVALIDMCGKVVQRGNELSEKQRAFARKLLQQIADRPVLLAAREAAEANRKPVPVTDKRLTVVGTIVSARYQESGWVNGFFKPEAVKIVVEHTDGWKVWGTLPSDLADGLPVEYGEPTWQNGAMLHTGRGINTEGLKGKRIQFDARVTPSDKDCKFGFFKRPTKASLLDAAPVAA